ncbi:MAG: acyl-CoA dehydrogenase, partial [Halobacteria archaeon]|nr:acyl-CoA dehydrogenase [Halobacteria archaeon]
MDQPIDYSRFNEGRHVNYWELDKALQYEVRRTYKSEDYEWAEDRLSNFGEIVGEVIADNADVIDDNGPELRTYDKHGNLINEVDYHPAQFENEQLTYGKGIVADSFKAPPGRDKPMPLTHNLAMEYLLCYVEVG